MSVRVLYPHFRVKPPPDPMLQLRICIPLGDVSREGCLIMERRHKSVWCSYYRTRKKKKLSLYLRKKKELPVVPFLFKIPPRCQSEKIAYLVCPHLPSAPRNSLPLTMFLSVAPRAQVFARSIRLPNEIGHRLAKGGVSFSTPFRIISFEERVRR
ncbi:hypothetical protein CDAR_436381 [Caerostris darwini]|uniref:Ribosomal protein S10 n=1 Tax=Caerostris darwini TaxID=1538125 RepID=A0AAV4R593_9ARAC|nr:hypothetical protein CDAR_436381 [Caerostris darwini]